MSESMRHKPTGDDTETTRSSAENPEDLDAQRHSIPSTRWEHGLRAVGLAGDVVTKLMTAGVGVCELLKALGLM